MNPLPPNADELVSAYLDGQATPDEVVIVESSPELMARVAAMRSVADLVSEPIAPPAAQKEAHISAALNAFDALFAHDVDQAPLASSPATPEVTATSISAEPATVDPGLVAPVADHTTPNGVTSLAAARQQRQPRRFNTGIIAAAAAVVLLFVAVAAFGLGGGEDSFDVASTASEAANDATDTTEIDSSTDAIAEAVAMDDDRPPSALEAAPAPTPASPQAAEAAAADVVMSDEEESMEAEDTVDGDATDTASDDGGGLDAEAGSAVATESLNVEPLRLFAGDFPDQESLLRELEQVLVAEFAQRLGPFEPGLFPSCQQNVPELAAIETPSHIGDASIAGQAVEIHRIFDGDDDVTIVLVDPTDCSVLPATP